MKTFAQSLLALWQQLGLNQRVSLVVAALAVVGGLIVVILWANRPDYQLLYARLGEKDAGAVISYLQAQNVPHQVTAGGSAVQVPANQVYKIRMELAGKGIPSGDGVGFEIFDKGQFGLSDFVQRTNYLRAVQGELARTVKQLQGVRDARVMIVQPENRLLLTGEGVKSTASVFVDVGGGRLETDQVNSIRHLVANAVQGLSVDQVAVVDNRGRVLSEDLKQDPTLGGSVSQMRHKQQTEDYLAKKVESMLAAVIGPGNAVVRVSAEIETEAVTEVRERFNPDSQVIRSQTLTEDVSTSAESRSAGGVVGVSANVPDRTAGTGDTARPVSSSDQNRKSRSTQFEIDRTTTNIVRQPGTVKNVTAAVFVAQRFAAAPVSAPGDVNYSNAPAAPTGPVPIKRSREELNDLRQIVVNALGVKPVPGQSLESIVSVQEVPFQGIEPIPAEIEAIQKEGRMQTWLDLASRWTAVIAACVVLLVFLRLLARQKPEPVPIEVLSMSPDAASRSTNPNAVTPELLNELIRQKPANIGIALRDWVATPASKN